MRDRRMDRLVVVFPFAGCVSHSSVAVCETRPRRVQTEASSPLPSGDGERKINKSSSSAVINHLPRPNSISVGVQKVIKSFKSLSEFLLVGNEEDDEEIEMEIGFPTDVKHVTHIGCDGLNSIRSTMNSWDKASDDDQFLSLSSSLSWKHYELAMATQAGVPTSH